MNIAEAKKHIKDTVRLYLKKDEYGEYRIPVVRQRPVFLLGAPGIGKTAIMEQIASELGIALVTYSMTHHTRQSALGLPFIEHRDYGGEKVAVSEYTMSEIIASVYETMEKSGIAEGILFLDEINCVSETLAPSMLQFLQYKVFGRHKVPDGWVIVTAGNPPQYNRSVREFDVVTLDRLKVLEVEADYPSFKKYASDLGLHGAVLGFLELNKDNFYQMEMTQEGRSYVTARGWEDLSEILFLYEEEGLSVSSDLFSQYIRNAETAREFEAYYELFDKYRKIYRIEEVLSGNAPETVYDLARNAQLDERLSLVSLLSSRVREEMKAVMTAMEDLRFLRPMMNVLMQGERDVSALIEGLDKARGAKEAAGSLDKETRGRFKRSDAFLNSLKNLSKEEQKSAFNQKVADVQDRAAAQKKRLHALFDFVSQAFGDQSDEMVMLVTELTISDDSASFISNFGLEDYEKYSALLMITDRKDQLRGEILEVLN